MHIQLYDLQPIVTAPQPTPPLNITFAETLTLRGIAPLVTEVFARDERLHPLTGVCWWCYIGKQRNPTPSPRACA
ncbi:MAG UNVERIFIED_CONTAM: hypothetical protein LVT10_22020 [Anaerolineae bacterium]